MPKLTESVTEDFALKQFECLGYSYAYAPDIASDDKNLARNLTNGEMKIGYAEEKKNFLS